MRLSAIWSSRSETLASFSRPGRASSRITYRSFSYSYPLTISSNGTSWPSVEQTRWYLILPWSFSCSWLNRRVFSSVAVYTRTGIDTRPKEMAPLHIVFMGTSRAGRSLDCIAGGTRSPRNSMPSALPVQAPPGPRLPHGEAPAAPRRARWRALVDGGRRPATQADQPGQGVLAAGGLHQGRPACLLLERPGPDPPLPPGPSPHPQAHARRDRGAVLLREERARAHPRLDAPLPGGERGGRGPDGVQRLPGGQRAGRPPVRRQHRSDRVPSAPRPLRVDRPP